MEKRLTGTYGEYLVAELYKKKGYRIIAVNYKTRFGEIDVAAEKEGTVAIVEVKTRQGKQFYTAREAVTLSKQEKIKAATAAFLPAFGLEDCFVRFDVAEVYDPVGEKRINIIEDAFE